MPATGPCACTALRKASRAATRLYDDALHASGLTATQYAALRAVQRGGRVPMTRVAEGLVMDRTTLYRTVRPLIAEGLLRCHDSEDDARAKRLELTTAGRRRVRRARAAWLGVQGDVVAAVGPDRWRAMSAWLDELTGELETLRDARATGA